MAIFSFLKAKPVDKSKASANNPNIRSVDNQDMSGEFKAYIPNFLYKPPFGYPLNKNILHLKLLAKNPFIFSVIRTLKEEASTAKWEIKLKKEFVDQFKGQEEYVMQQKQRIAQFFYNPNGNDESFGDILSQWVQDLCEVDAAVGVKVFNKQKQFVQLFARDGGSFLKNPNIYGYMGDRAEFVDPVSIEHFNTLPEQDRIKMYEFNYKEAAAYFQYGWTGVALPVPFGRREIIYICANPRSDNVYGRSPLELLHDTILNLVYGQQYNLDFYINGNLPEGMIHLAGADDDIVKAWNARMQEKFKFTDELDNKRRVGHVYPVYGGPAADFIPFTLSAKDMEVLEQSKWWIKMVWMCFGVTPDEMGFTESSNRSVGETQGAVHKRKALRPLLKKIEYSLNTQILPELDPSKMFEFAFEDYDLDEDLKKHQLYASQIQMGIKTPEMVAEEEGIDTSQLQASRDKEQQRQIDMETAVQNKQTEAQVKALKAEKYLNMPLDDLIDEHQKLIKVLEEDNPEDIAKELKEQKKELESYIKKRGGSLKAEKWVTIHGKPVKLEDKFGKISALAEHVLSTNPETDLNGVGTGACKVISEKMAEAMQKEGHPVKLVSVNTPDGGTGGHVAVEWGDYIIDTQTWQYEGGKPSDIKTRKVVFKKDEYAKKGYNVSGELKAEIKDLHDYLNHIEKNLINNLNGKW